MLVFQFKRLNSYYPSIARQPQRQAVVRTVPPKRYCMARLQHGWYRPPRVGISHSVRSRCHVFQDGKVASSGWALPLATGTNLRGLEDATYDENDGLRERLQENYIIVNYIVVEIWSHSRP
jgi:hypothetical protein